jgi:hypothetical protein
VTLRPAIGALLPPKELLAHTLHQVLRTSSSHKKTSVSIAVGFIGLVFFFSLLELSVRSELAKEGAAIDALPAASTNPEQIEFVERFAIQPRNPPISLEAADQSGTAGATAFSGDVQTFGRVSQPVPLPRPRKPR